MNIKLIFILLRSFWATGWSRYYSGGSSAYLGFDEKVQGPYNSTTSALSFPGISPAAAHLLVQRKVAGVGLDTGSIDAIACKLFFPPLPL